MLDVATCFASVDNCDCAGNAWTGGRGGGAGAGAGTDKGGGRGRAVAHTQQRLSETEFSSVHAPQTHSSAVGRGASQTRRWDRKEIRQREWHRVSSNSVPKRASKSMLRQNTIQ